MSCQRVNPSLREIKNQKGQISVFVALSFLILFTMFAMTVNVAMVVHDKINMQNAVDFAAIYVAQRQAEQLNAIAHFNYQIRQAHKLLAYRYIVIGTAGIKKDTPANRTSPQDTETKYNLADKVMYPPCLGIELLFQDIVADQWCQEKWYAGGFSGIPILNVVNNYLGSNSSLKATTITLGKQIQADALLANIFSWWFVNLTYATFRQQVGYRKGLIKALASNLSKPIVAGSAGMKDLYGESVYDGAYKTFLFNLSESNKSVTDNYGFTVVNSLNGIDHKRWLPEIKTIIAPMYADRDTNMGGNGQVGNIKQRWFYEMPMSWGTASSVHTTFLDRVDPDKFLRSFSGGAGMPLDHDLEEILGYEKNPWYMVYAQVMAQSVSNALFSLTPGTPMQAQAFAKPFGGRIGPWYGKRWSSGADASNGPKTVEIWSPRKTSGGPSSPSDPTVSPNAPKYPGDVLGWQSTAALSSTGQVGRPSVLHEKFYKDLAQNLFPGGSADALANDPTMREKEMNAVAPDIFDIYYYSIDSNFHQNYLEGKLDKWLMAEAQYNSISHSDPKIWRDLGYIRTNQQDFSVHKQLTQSTRRTLGPQSFFALESSDEKGRAFLLTSWVPGREVMDYRTPASGGPAARFGKCGQFYNGQKYNVPGECLHEGGRVGYSVKIISKDYLKSPDHNMGGGTGAIANPPQ